MQVKIEELKKSFAESLALATSAEALESLRVEYLGKKGHIASLMQQLQPEAHLCNLQVFLRCTP